MKNKGFSLVELIVVIAIMAILVGVAVPVYTSYIEKAQKATDEQYLADVVYAAQLFAAENGLELDKIAIAPVVKADTKQGIEVFLKDGARVNDLTDLYAMVGGYTFSTMEEGTEVHYHQPTVSLPSNPDTPDNHIHAFNEVVQTKTCTRDGVNRCTCGATEVDSADGHIIGSDYIQISNLRVYSCMVEGCNYMVGVPSGDGLG